MTVRNTNVLIAPVVTEKTVAQTGKYVFSVHPDATKPDVKAAVLEHYGVEVVKVNITSLPEKTRTVGRGRTLRKRKPTKKATVTLKEGATLDFNAFK